MKNERLFRILGLIDEELIEEAAAPAPARKKSYLKPMMGLAACLAVVCLVSLPVLFGGSRKEEAAAPQSPEGSYTGIETEKSETAASDMEPLSTEGTTFMSYAGPVLPMTVLNETEGLSAQRSTIWDFTPRDGHNGSPHQWGASVTDNYVLMNHTTGEILAMACLPIPASFIDLEEMQPTLSVNGEEQDWTLYAGAYAGGFRDAGVDDGSTWNLMPPNSWTDYKAILEDSQYLTAAMDESAFLSESVTVYSFTDFQAPSNYPAATQAIEFTIDPAKTTILSYGFNGMSWDEDSGWRQYDYFVPNGKRRDISPKMLIVLGEDIGGYSLCGYEDGGCEPGEELPGVSCTVTRHETTLDAIIEELCAAYVKESSWHLGVDEESVFSFLSMELYCAKVTELLLQHGMFAGSETKDRYADGRLDDIFAETLTQQRILYLVTEVPVPAGSSVELSINLWKAPSHDYGCSGSAKANAQGYDYATTLGSTLSFTAQSAALKNTDGIELLDQNFGFDLEQGITEVSLDPNQEHYYLEIRPLA